jgi:hypothetical protein
LLDTISYEVSKAVETQTNVAGTDIMGMGMPTPLPSYTEVEQKEMLAADSDSEWNVVKPTQRDPFVDESAGLSVVFRNVRVQTRLIRRRTRIPFLS